MEVSALPRKDDVSLNLASSVNPWLYDFSSASFQSVIQDNCSMI